jgi:tetratricopeptide (TPR) repeat protein
MSGDKMSCTSCHDPHYSPTAQERVEYFRGKCLACHGEQFGAKHHAKQRDCTSCHMPELPSKDVAHTEVTDHRIPRLGSASPQLLQDVNASSARLQLVPFPDSPEAEKDLRDLALAWESFANTGVDGARSEAREMLRRSAAQFPGDAPTLSALGYEEQMRGEIAQARDLYRQALAGDPSLLDAGTNLGVIEAETGNFPEAINLLESAFERAPGRSSIGMDLARVYCLSGNMDGARASITRVLEFNPDLNAARRLLKDFSAPTSKCTGS